MYRSSQFRHFSTFIAVTAVVFFQALSQQGKAQSAYPGYTLYSAMNSKTSYLLDMGGNVAHSWQHTYAGGYSCYLLPSGNLLRMASAPGSHMTGPASSGLIQEFDWDGNVVWQYTYATSTVVAHHDIEPMPNGNVLVIAYEVKSSSQASAAGRQNATTMWPEHIIELQPSGGSANIVWEWHLWDHLIQDKYPTRANYGVVADHPELLNINLGTLMFGLGDWMHMNAVNYNPELDQIAFSSHYFSEVYVIDHSTTTSQAAGHTGGRWGKGGDILYRWGKPANYGAPGAAYCNVVHCAWWIPKGLPGEGRLLAFNNGVSTHTSSVFELVLPVDANGNYVRTPGTAYGPAAPVWTYSNGSAFSSDHLGGNQRLPNGNTFITESTKGRLFEVTPSGSIVWQYNTGKEVARSLRYGMDYPGVSRLNTAPKIAGPAAVSFDTVALGSSAVRDVVIRNTGAASLSISSVDISPPAFSIVSGGGPRNIDAGDSVAIQLRFNPAGAGPAAGSLSISSNASNGSVFTIALSGVGRLSPALSLNTQQLDFGKVLIGASSTLPLRISNTGGAPLAVSGITIAGTDAADFGIVTPCPSVIPAAGADSILLSFTPSTVGSKGAELRIESSDPKTPVTIVTLAGSGDRLLPAIELGADELDFDTVLVSSHASRVLRIRNSGAAPLEITGAAIGGQDAASFLVERPCASLLDPQAEDSIILRFAPSTAGLKRASLVVGSNDPANPLRTVALLGVAAPRLPRLAYAPASVSFDTVEVGKFETRIVHMTNSGNGALSIQAQNIGGVDPACFSIIKPCGAVVQPGGSDSIVLRFAPASEGMKQAVLSFTSDDISSSFVSIPLNGHAVRRSPVIRLDAASLDFGAVQLGTQSSRRLSIRNAGAAALRLSEQSIGGADSSEFTIVHAPGSAIDPGSADSMDLRFTPSSAGSKAAALRIRSDDPVSPLLTVALTGAGVTAAAPRITADPPAVDFGVSPPGVGKTLAVKVGNTGTADLLITGQSISGADFADFAVASPCAATISPSTSDSILLSFLPVGLGAKSALLSISGNDSSSPVVRIVLTGICAESAAPRIRFSRSFVDYGGISAQKDESLYVGNTGAADLLIQQCILLGADAADFNVTTPPAASIATGDSSLLTIRFTPSAPGPRGAFLRVQSNDPLNGFADIPLSAVAVGAETAATMPTGFSLHSGHPNPFSRSVSLLLEMPAAGDMQVSIVDRLGRVVRALHSGRFEAGTHGIFWDGRDGAGMRAAPGVYHCVAAGAKGPRTATLVLLPER